MKKHTLFLSILAGLLMGVPLSSCDYLDQQPDNLLTADQIWDTKANAEAYLHNLYSYVYQGDGGDWASMGVSDESSVSIPGTNARQMVIGNWSPGSGYFDMWGTYYVGIRKSFVFEDNIDKVPAAQLGDELKAQYKAEAQFLRGWFYWLLLKQYGPYVLLDGTLAKDEDFHQYARAPFDDCVAHINGLMDQAYAVLPVAWPSSNNLGRPTKGSCLGVKAQLALLVASPLWNGNPNFANFKNYDGTPLAPTSYDANKWKVAADAAKAVIDLNTYQLFTNLDEGSNTFDPYLSVRNIFLTDWNNEIIFSFNGWSRWGFTKCSSPGPGGYNMYNPTQNIVDAFYMRNGKTIDDPTSGYVETGFAVDNDATTWGHQKGDWNMYANREARFYAYINYNGRPVLAATNTDDKNYYSSPANVDGKGRTEYYYNGKSGILASGGNNITGYGVSKRVSPNDNIRYDATSFQGPYILIRYAEILLNYVEALNEYNPSDADIVTYLNLVRERAGLPGIEEVYPEAVGNQDLMRKYILRERQVELCFESDRYYTLLRRLQMGESKHRAISTMNVNAHSGDLGFSFTGFYTRTAFQNRYWDDKMYLFPIGQGDIERNRALVQNPGW
jgi:starch-binding outer membrane protein, SusD/RagB family